MPISKRKHDVRYLACWITKGFRHFFIFFYYLVNFCLCWFDIYKYKIVYFLLIILRLLNQSVYSMFYCLIEHFCKTLFRHLPEIVVFIFAHVIEEIFVFIWGTIKFSSVSIFLKFSLRIFNFKCHEKHFLPNSESPCKKKLVQKHVIMLLFLYSSTKMKFLICFALFLTAAVNGEGCGENCECGISKNIEYYEDFNNNQNRVINKCLWNQEYLALLDPRWQKQ